MGKGEIETGTTVITGAPARTNQIDPWIQKGFFDRVNLDELAKENGQAIRNQVMLYSGFISADLIENIKAKLPDHPNLISAIQKSAFDHPDPDPQLTSFHRN